MAKIYGLFGTMTGKVADVVMYSRNGEQVVRKYQPSVMNPKTDGQLASRARLKLLSQLSAIMAPVIAIPREGVVSSRNLFTQENYDATSYANNQAQVTLTNVKLTKGVISLPSIVAQREGTTLTVKLQGTGFTNLSRVVYAFFLKSGNATLRYFGSQVSDTPGDFNVFQATTTLENANDSVVVYAYGVRDNTDAARVKFGDLTVVNAETIAKVIVSRSVLETDITLTETKALESNPSI